MDKVLWKSILLILLLVASFVAFLAYANFRMRDVSLRNKAECEKIAREEAVKGIKANENGIAAPSQEAYDAAYQKCMDQRMLLSPQ